jgi:hypothetical protein
MPKAKAFGEVVAEARRTIAEARVSDPNEHYPYKADKVHALLSANPAMGPAGPDDDSVQAADFTSTRIVDATKVYVDAQKAVALDPSRENREAYQVATADLVAARQAHRRYRTDADGRPAAAIIGTTDRSSFDHLRGPRFRRPGEA